MSDLEARPAPTRGRSSRGRGGFSSRGGPRGHNATRKPTNGTAMATEAPSIEEDDILGDQGELGEMRKKYASELGMLKDMFPDWTDVDLVFALQETNGDLPSTVDKITEGNVSQFAEVKKNKDRARSKAAKDEPAAVAALEKSTARGGRGRGGFEGSRGTRGRGSDRGRGGLRGGRGGHATTNGTPKEASATSVPTAESTAWDTTAAAETAESTSDTAAPDVPKEVNDDHAQSSWENVVTADTTPASASEGMKSSLIPDGAPKKSWASMFSKPKPAAVAMPAKQASAPHSLPAELAAMEQASTSNAQDVVEPNEPQTLPQPSIEEMTAREVFESTPLAAQDMPEEALLPTLQAPLTEENVENLPDKSHPPATETVASTAGSMDTRHLTPLPSQSTPASRPPIGGFATSAYRATGTPARSASYQRKVQEQLEAVVMPGHNAIDRAAVQFGSMGLNGEPGSDVDEDREEPETRHAPQHSPPALPKTSLPPAPRQAAMVHEASEGLPTPKQAPGLPPASTQNQQHMQDAGVATALAQEQAQMNAGYNYYRYPQPGMHQDSSIQQQKPYDPFAHQAQPSQYDPYGSHAQSQQAPQHQQAQSGFSGLSSAPSDYSSYYTSDQSRNTYNQYYGSYGQPDSRGLVGQNQQEAGLGQQRSASGFGTGPNDPAFQSQTQQQVPSRYNEALGSGQNTPNPIMSGQQQPGQAPQQLQHSMHPGAHQQQQQQPGGYPPGASAAYPYGHPYYSSPYQTAYQNQFGYSHPSGGYGGGYQTKPQAGMYNVPQGYSQSSYDQHSSSPANSGAFGSAQQNSMRSASGMSAGLGGGLDEYGRATAQSGSHQQSVGFGGMNDPFIRSTSGFGGQAGYGQQTNAGGLDDSLKPFSETKGGPSPALGQPGRPGSAANSAVGTSQSGLPPPQSQQQSTFGSGYPGFSGQNSQYGGLGGLGNQQQGQQGQQGQGAYSQYSAGFNQTYGGYGSQQQRGGWGSNYGAH